MKKRLIILSLIAVMVLGLAACGSSSDNGSLEASGTPQTSGQISVTVPEGFTLNSGSVLTPDIEDDTQCFMQRDPDNMYDYIWIAIKPFEESAQSSVDMTQAANDARNISFFVGDIQWKGCTYTSESVSTGEIDCGQVYATVNDVTYLVSFSGYDPEGADMTSVLSSLGSAE